MMKYINEVDLQGEVGKVIGQRGDGRVEYTLKTVELVESKVTGAVVASTVWHICRESSVTGAAVKPGDQRHISGCIEQARYINQEGDKCYCYTIKVNRTMPVEL